MEYSIHSRGYLECLEYSRHARYLRRELKFNLLLLMNCLELNSGVAFSVSRVLLGWPYKKKRQTADED